MVAQGGRVGVEAAGSRQESPTRVSELVRLDI